MRTVILSSCVLMMLFMASVGFATAPEEDVSFFDPTKIQATPISAQPNKAEVDQTEPSPTPTIQQGDKVTITITAVGDTTIGTNHKKYSKMEQSIFGKELKRQDGDMNFYLKNIKDVLLSDDLTIANFEGTLADKVTIPSEKSENSYLFRAPVEFATTLLPNGIEAVSLENNHVYDFGEDGYQSTVDALEAQGVVYSNKTTLGVYEVKGIKIGMLSYQTFNGAYDEIYATMPGQIQSAREEGCDIVIVSYHWGDELDYHPNTNQQKLGKATIDAGADLVLGHHSHRINPIEEYKGKYIVYSLGNFSFAGHSNPSDKFTFIFQIRFMFREGEIWKKPEFRIIPASISSKKEINDFIVTPLDNRISIDTVLLNLEKNGKRIDNPVESYPLEWN